MLFPEIKIEKNTINGAIVYKLYKKDAPLAIRFTFFAGSRFDEKPGVAHCLEHLFVASTSFFKSKDQIAKYLEQFGGNFSATTGNDVLRVNIEISDKEDIEKALLLMKSFLDRRIFDNNVFENERKSILSEFLEKKSNPSKFVWELRRKNSFAGTPLENSIIGTEQEVLNITVDDVIKHHDKNITSGKLNIVIAGDFEENIVDNIKQNLPEIKIEKYLGLDNIFFPKMLPNKNRNKIIEKNIADGKQAYTVCSLAIFDKLSVKEKIALKIFNNIFGVGRGSVLLSNLRYKESFVYSAFSSLNGGYDWSIFDIYFSSNYQDINKCIEIIKQQVIEIKNGKISKEEFENEKNRIIKNLKRELQTTNDLVNFCEQLFIFEENLSLKMYKDAFDDLKLEDFLIVINKFVKEDQFNVAICR
ncbi:MAG: pitrilysin family protein [Candidatus Paceibacterota bacterium]|jgi:predicted Zn-dependent peptidase